MAEMLFYSALPFMSIFGRVNSIYMRSGMGMALTRSLPAVAIELVGAFSSLAIIVWGMIHINWWLPIILMLVMAIIAGTIVNVRTLGIYSSLYLLFGLIIISLNIALWVL